MWEVLFNRYQRKGKMALLALKDRLREVEFRGRETVKNLEKFLALFDNRLLEYKLAGGAMTDEEQVHILVKALPRPYSLCRKLILNEKTERVNLTWAKEKIREEQVELVAYDQLDGSKKKGGDQEKAFNVTKKKKNWKKNIRCFNCNKLGHFKNECNNEKEDGKDEALMATPGKVAQGDILFDAGASRHMFTNKRDFDKYHVLKEPTEVVIGNGKVVLGVGRGEVLLNTSVGGRVRLQNV